MKKFIVPLLAIFVATSLFLMGCTTPVENTTTTVPPTTTTVPPTTTTSSTIYVDHGSNLVGVSTSSFSDGNLSLASLQTFKPRFMRYYLGSTIVFDASDPTKGVASVTNTSYDRNDELSSIMAANMSGWSYTPQLTFDEFIALCQALDAEPVVLLPVYAAYSTTQSPKMTQTQMEDAHVAFVTYANITKGYGVKYWEIGNEDDLGPDNTSAATYAAVFNSVVPKLKAVDPTILCGANTFWDTARWTALLPLIKDNMGFAVIHQYSALTNYNDFVTKDMVTWLGGDGKNQIFVDHFNEAYNGLAPSNRPASNQVIATEMSSRWVFESDSNVLQNNVWRGLHNIQLILQYGKYDNVLGTMNWVTWYNGGINKSYNVFTDSSETSLTPIGLTLKVLSDHLYSVVEAKTKPLGNLVEITRSRSADSSKLSIFLVNKSKVEQTVTLDLSGPTDLVHYTKWIYSPSTVEELSQNVWYGQVDSSAAVVDGQSIVLPPLSCTVYDFDGLN